jgi:sugar-specific transcriptional regulator TrmB
MFEKYLEELGLGDKEAAVYVALLAVDHASVLDVAKKTKIKRPTVYVALDSLEKKGLVSETQVGKKVHYLAEPPERLETYVERQKVILEEQQKRLKDFIPQLKSIQRESGERPTVKYFEGREGIVSSLEEFFYGEPESAGGTAYLIYPRDLRDEVFSREEIDKYQKFRLQRKVKTKVLYTYEKGEIPSDEMGERKKIDGTAYPLTCDIMIYKDKVRINVLGKTLSGIFIRSEDVAQTLQSIFNLAFDSTKKNASGEIPEAK